MVARHVELARDLVVAEIPVVAEREGNPVSLGKTKQRIPHPSAGLVGEDGSQGRRARLTSDQPAVHFLQLGREQAGLQAPPPQQIEAAVARHAEEPAVERERRVVYSGFGLPSRGDEVIDAREDIKNVREQSYKKVSQEPSPIVRGEAGRMAGAEREELRVLVDTIP